MKLALTLLAASAAALASTASATLDWAAVTNRDRPQNGQQTYYGQVRLG